MISGLKARSYAAKNRKIKAMSRRAAVGLCVSEKVAEQTVWRVKKMSIPAEEVRKSRRRPDLSTRRDANSAQHRFQIWRTPLIRSCVFGSEMPMVSKTFFR